MCFQAAFKTADSTFNFHHQWLSATHNSKKKRKKENPKGENKIFMLDFSSSHL